MDKELERKLGFRPQESQGRAKKEVFGKMGISNSVLTWYEWLPVHNLLTDEIFEVIAASGQTPHYAYALGNHRLSCVFCIMGSVRDLKNGARHNPELLNEYDALEQRTGYTMHMKRIPIRELTS